MGVGKGILAIACFITLARCRKLYSKLRETSHNGNVVQYHFAQFHTYRAESVRLKDVIGLE